MILPIAWSSLMTSRKEYLSFHAFVQHARAGLLLGRLLTQKEAAAEFRVHGIGPFLLGHSAPWPRPASPSRPGWPAAPPGSGSCGRRGGFATLLTYGAPSAGCCGAGPWIRRSRARPSRPSVPAARAWTPSSFRSPSCTKSPCSSPTSNSCAERRRTGPIPAGGQPLPERLREVRFESGTFPCPPARLPCRNRRCATSACPSRPGRSPRWWARPAQASPPSSNSWPACTRRTRAAA